MTSALLRTAAVAALTVLAAPGADAQSQRTMTIGAGGVTGVYYAAAGAVCRLVNKDRRQHGVRCAVESTGGSAANIAGLRGGAFDFGITQSDAQHDAARDPAAVAAGPAAELRSVLALHSEPVTVVARKELGARRLDDLKGRRLSIGAPGSGVRVTAETLLRALGWGLADTAQLGELRADAHGPALCEDRIDAFIHVVGHPSANIQDPTASCGARLLPVVGPAVDALIAERPYYARAVIPGGLYASNPDPIATYGVVAVLTTTAAASDELVEILTGAVLGNLDEFRGLHPALARLDPARMARDGMTAPLHPAAAAQLRARGHLR